MYISYTWAAVSERLVANASRHCAAANATRGLGSPTAGGIGLAVHRADMPYPPHSTILDKVACITTHPPCR